MGVTEQSDVLVQGDDRDRWRPSRRLILLGVVLAVLAAGATGAYAYRAHERDLDRRAEKAVSVSLAGFDAVMSGQGVSQGYPMMIANDGASAVTVVGAQLVGPGYRSSPTTLRLEEHTTQTLLVRPGSGCDQRLYTSPPTGVRLSVRTTRGTVVRRTLPLLGDDLQLLQSQERARCGFLKPSEALTLEAQSAVRSGRDVRVSFRALNGSRFPLTIERITAPAGVSVLPHPPLSVPATMFSGSPENQTITLTLRVTDCRTFVSAWQEHDAGIQPGGDTPDVTALLVRVSNGRETEPARASLQSFFDDASQNVDATALLLDACTQTVGGTTTGIATP